MKNSQFSKIKGPKRRILEMTKKALFFYMLRCLKVYFLRIGSFTTFKIGIRKYEKSSDSFKRNLQTYLQRLQIG